MYKHIQNCPEIYNLYEIYLDSCEEGSAQSLEEIVDNVAHGELKDFSLYECVEGVLKAMVFNAETPLEEKIRMAEEDYPCRFATMTREQQEVCLKFRLSFVT